MGQQDLKQQLLEQGFVVVKNIIPKVIIDNINDRVCDLYPTRGHAVDNKYYPRSRIHECPEFALWWSQQLHDWREVQSVGRILIDQVGFLFDNPAVYVADVITNTPNNKYIKPHIDSPYRFDQWHESFELLGVQCIVPLCEFTIANGGTGLLPGSHKRNWVVQDSYRGLYNEQFMAGVQQPHMMPGDVLVYFPRVLHSTMPNITEQSRRALLVHVTSQAMIEQMKLVDNIWLE
jgi:ectoine hydroxylase-related dioxygenase (phytanoyl-CoA dioxygenase family)